MKWSITFLLLATAVVGCQNRATPLSNPFLSPDRVPPPPTRVLAPGTAQPYYNNSQQVAPAVTPSGPNTYAPGAGIAPTGGYGSISAVDPRSFADRRIAGSGDLVSIPPDGRATHLAVRPAVAEIARPATIGLAFANEQSATPRSSIRTVQQRSTRTVQNNSGWLPPGHSKTPTTAPVAVASRTSPRYFAAPPDETNDSAAPAAYYPAQAYPTEFYTNQAYQNQAVIIGSEMVMMEGCYCSPCGPFYAPGGVHTVEIADLPLAECRTRSTPARNFSARTASSDGFRARGSSRPTRVQRTSSSDVRIASAECWMPSR